MTVNDHERSARRADDLEARRKSFGSALAKRRKDLDLSQTALGEALGGIGQSAISQWESGETQPRTEHVYGAEKVLGLTPGTLSRILGYLPPSAPSRAAPGEVRQAIRRDPLLTEKEKRSLVTLYDAIVAGRRGRVGPAS